MGKVHTMSGAAGAAQKTPLTAGRPFQFVSPEHTPLLTVNEGVPIVDALQHLGHLVACASSSIELAASDGVDSELVPGALRLTQHTLEQCWELIQAIHNGLQQHAEPRESIGGEV